GVMQALLRLLVQLGAVEEARRRLHSFGARLQTELGFPPSAETELIVAGSQQHQAGEPASQYPSDVTHRRPRLTAPLTSFIGREQDLAGCVERLSSASCRLLT